MMVATIHAVRQLRETRAREVRDAQLERSLAQAQLENLRLQLQPHFLFNALNTISSTMYESPETADEMMDNLAELLRSSLRTTGAGEVTEPSDAEIEASHAEFVKSLEYFVRDGGEWYAVNPEYKPDNNQAHWM